MSLLILFAKFFPFWINSSLNFLSVKIFWIASLNDFGVLSTSIAKSLIISGLESNSCLGSITGIPYAAASIDGIAKPPYFIGSAKISAAA